MGHKNKLGLSLSGKMFFLGPKLGGKIENNVHKLTNLKKKLFGPQKQAGAELKQKNVFFWSKIGKKNLE